MCAATVCLRENVTAKECTQPIDTIQKVIEMSHQDTNYDHKTSVKCKCVINKYVVIQYAKKFGGHGLQNDKGSLFSF